MIEKRYGRYAQHRARRPVLEYRWSEWADRHGDHLASALASLLADGQPRTLEALGRHAVCVATNAWMAATGDQPGTFVPRRDVQLNLGLVHRASAVRGTLGASRRTASAYCGSGHRWHPSGQPEYFLSKKFVPRRAAPKTNEWSHR